MINQTERVVNQWEGARKSRKSKKSRKSGRVGGVRSMPYQW